MSRPFPKDEPMLQGVFASVLVEGDSCDLPVTGEILEALNGTFYRNEQALFNAVAQLDLASGRTALFAAPDGDSLGEPVFAPRSAESAEGDGFLLTVQYISEENRSDLLILDASDLENGPVARVHLSHRVPAGFYGSWVPASES